MSNWLCGHLGCGRRPSELQYFGHFPVLALHYVTTPVILDFTSQTLCMPLAETYQLPARLLLWCYTWAGYEI